jgi:hypothetical protein
VYEDPVGSKQGRGQGVAGSENVAKVCSAMPSFHANLSASPAVTSEAGTEENERHTPATRERWRREMKNCLFVVFEDLTCAWKQQNVKLQAV